LRPFVKLAFCLRTNVTRIFARSRMLYTFPVQYLRKISIFLNVRNCKEVAQTLTPVSRTRTLNEVKRNSSKPVGTAVSVTRLSEPGVASVGTITLIVNVETDEVEVVVGALKERPMFRLRFHSFNHLINNSSFRQATTAAFFLCSLESINNFYHEQHLHRQRRFMH